MSSNSTIGRVILVHFLSIIILVKKLEDDGIAFSMYMFRISDSREEISTCYMSEAIIKYGKDIIIPHPWISIIKKNRQ